MTDIEICTLFVKNQKTKRQCLIITFKKSIKIPTSLITATVYYARSICFTFNNKKDHYKF